MIFEPSLLEKAKLIKLVILDIDGVMTNGQLDLDNNLISSKSFHVRDGFGIRQLLKENIQIAVITGRESELVAERIRELKIPHLYQNSPDKLPIFKQLLLSLNLEPSEVAYMGDDLIDLPVMSRVGLAAAPSDAYFFVKDFLKKNKQFIATNPGGFGAVREFCDLILESQGKLKAICEQFLIDGSELPKEQQARYR